MKKIVTLSILALVISSCNEEKTDSSPQDIERVNTIEGTWKMVYGEVRENDSLDIKDLKNTDFVKIINKDHFAFFNQNHHDGDGFYAGGGSYTLVGNKYTETLNYTSAEAIRGHSFPFTIEIKGDTLIQHGLEEVKEANIKRNILEKYIRVAYEQPG